MRSVVLLSAGLDSTLNLYEAMRSSEVVLAVTFNYGQRAALREINFSEKLCAKLKIKHRVVDLTWMRDFGGSALVDSNLEIPTDKVKIDDLKISRETAKSVWVPNRNGILLNIAAGFAESLSADWIVPGFNIEEAATFPDNSQDFLLRMTDSLKYSTANHVQVKCFSTELNKTEIVKRGHQLNMDFNLVWPCYFDGESPCGRCESCKRFVRAMGANQISTHWMNNEN